jgi:tetratricopeptide (TPR) repeat protein
MTDSKSAYEATKKAAVFVAKLMPLLLIVALLYQYLHDTLIIRPFTVTRDLQDRGLTDFVVAEELRQRIYEIKKRVSIDQSVALGIGLTQEETDITIPTTNISVSSILDLLSEVLPWSPRTTISGAFVNETGRLCLIVFLNDKQIYDSPISQKRPTPAALISDAANTVVEAIHPLWRAADLYDGGETTAATNVLVRAINRAQYPGTDVADAYLLLGRIALDVGSPKDACYKFWRALQIDPYSADAYRYLSDVLTYDSKTADLAVAAARRAVTLSLGQDSWSYFALGNSYYSSGAEFPDAKRAYVQAIRLSFENRFAHDGLAHTDLMLDDRSDAMKEYGRAIDLGDTPFAKALFDRAQLFMEENRQREAWADFASARDADPFSKTTYYEIGRYYFESGNAGAAVPEFYRAFQIAPKDENAFSAFEIAVVNADKGEGAAIEHYLRDDSVCESSAYLLGGEFATILRQAAKIRCSDVSGSRGAGSSDAVHSKERSAAGLDPTQPCASTRPFAKLAELEFSPAVEILPLTEAVYVYDTSDYLDRNARLVLLSLTVVACSVLLLTRRHGR